ncbi:MAG: peroxiredoxin [Pseudomonadota bacterium]
MSLTDVDWSGLPQPEDDGAAAHLPGLMLPLVSLPSTTGGSVDVGQLAGLSVLYVYPMTGRPDRALPEGWDMIPGARGCTPQSCAFRDHFDELRALGVQNLFGVSTQDTAEQAEAAARLHLPFALLSDAALELADALSLPRFEVEGRTLLKRMTLFVEDRQIVRVHYPVFPPDADATRVLTWLKARSGSSDTSSGAGTSRP